MTPVSQIVGRDAELATIDAFVRATGEPGSPPVLLLVGEPGLGKSTLLDAVVRGARGAGIRVLAARPTEAEARLAFAGLADLFEGADEQIAELPSAQRRALEVALLRSEPDAALEPRALGPAVLGVLRLLSAAESILIAVDDLGWLDAATADALAFALRRMKTGHLRVALARRPGTLGRLDQALAGDTVQRMDLGPISLEAMRRLLHDRLGLVPTRRGLRTLHEQSRGNPLFAIELARLGPGDDSLAAGLHDQNVPPAVEELLGARIDRLPAAAQDILLAVALSPGPRVDELMGLAPRPLIDELLATGVLVQEGDRVRAGHPLFASVAVARADPPDRRRIHAWLARMATDPGRRARHRALATEGPDTALGAQLERAAIQAAARGAAEDAADLAEQSFRLTPVDAPEHDRRLLLVAERRMITGDKAGARGLLEPALAALPPGPVRARVRVHLQDARFELEKVSDVGAELEQALVESQDDPRVQALVLARLARFRSVGLIEDLRRAEADAVRAWQSARGVWPEVELDALNALAWARHLRGGLIDDLRVPLDAAASAGPMFRGFERLKAERLVVEGRVEAAASMLEHLAASADAHGETWTYAFVLLQQIELDLRAGRWASAASRLEEWIESPERELASAGTYERCRSLLASGLGDAAEAERWATIAVRRGEDRGLQWNRLEALRALGLAALLAGRPDDVIRHLGPVWERTRRHTLDPGVFPAAPDFAEALLEVGDRDRARAVANDVRRFGARRDHPWARLTARRIAALVDLDSTSHEHLAAELRAVADAYCDLGLMFDQARTLLALGRAERRLRKWGAARRTLETAAAAFAALGSDGWLRRVQGELDRVGPRRPHANGGLTIAELRVAELAADGLSNKDIAHALSVSVGTIEAHLSRVYAKLGIASRVSLARHLAS